MERRHGRGIGGTVGSRLDLAARELTVRHVVILEGGAGVVHDGEPAIARQPYDVSVGSERALGRRTADRDPVLGPTRHVVLHHVLGRDDVTAERTQDAAVSIVVQAAPLDRREAAEVDFDASVRGARDPALHDHVVARALVVGLSGVGIDAQRITARWSHHERVLDPVATGLRAGDRHGVDLAVRLRGRAVRPGRVRARRLRRSVRARRLRRVLLCAATLEEKTPKHVVASVDAEERQRACANGPHDGAGFPVGVQRVDHDA